MEKTYVVSFGYNHLGAKSKEAALDLLEATILQSEYVNGENIYTPKKEEVKVELIDSSKIRSLTKEEVENKALKDAESTAAYYKGEAANHKKEIEELKCQIKVLTARPEED